MEDICRPCRKYGICINENCTISASFNYPNQKKRLYCSDHKLYGLQILGLHICITDQCNKIAGWKVRGELKAIT
jgi:hypothetical protein